MWSDSAEGRGGVVRPGPDFDVSISNFERVSCPPHTTQQQNYITANSVSPPHAPTPHTETTSETATCTHSELRNASIKQPSGQRPTVAAAHGAAEGSEGKKGTTAVPMPALSRVVRDVHAMTEIHSHSHTHAAKR